MKISIDHTFLATRQSVGQRRLRLRISSLVRCSAAGIAPGHIPDHDSLLGFASPVRRVAALYRPPLSGLGKSGGLWPALRTSRVCQDPPACSAAHHRVPAQDLGVPPRDAQTILGHAHITTTQPRGRSRPPRRNYQAQQAARRHRLNRHRGQEWWTAAASDRDLLVATRANGMPVRGECGARWGCLLPW